MQVPFALKTNLSFSDSSWKLLMHVFENPFHSGKKAWAVDVQEVNYLKKHRVQ